MTGTEALGAINRAGVQQNLRIRVHAWDRMDERGALFQDVCNAAMTATAATWQEEHQSWLATGGVDLDGEDLKLAFAVEADVVIITVF